MKKIRSEEGILLRKEGLVEFLPILIPKGYFLKPEKGGEKDREKVFFAFFADFLLSKAKKTMKKRWIYRYFKQKSVSGFQFVAKLKHLL